MTKKYKKGFMTGQITEHNPIIMCGFKYRLDTDYTCKWFKTLNGAIKHMENLGYKPID